MRKKLILLASMLAMLLMVTAYAWSATGPYPAQGTAGSIVVPEKPSEDELLCLLPEGCDIDGDGVPDFRAGEPVQGGKGSTGFEQYNSI